MNFEKQMFGALYADAVTKRQLYDAIESAIDERSPLRVTYANAHNVNVAESDAAYREALHSFHIVFPEGIGMAMAARMLGYHKHELFHTTDFWADLFPCFREKGIRLFLLGSTKETLALASERFASEGITVAGTADGYGDVEDAERLLARIHSAAAGVLFVGMGVPRQEIWVAEHHYSIETPVIICAGNFFEFFAGTVPRAPRYMRKMHLEWFHRMLVEPRRLWKRYLIGIPRFLLRVRS